MVDGLHEDRTEPNCGCTMEVRSVCHCGSDVLRRLSFKETLTSDFFSRSGTRMWHEVTAVTPSVRLGLK